MDKIEDAIVDDDQLILQFGPKITIILPKDNVLESWDKLKQYMEIYLDLEDKKNT